MGLEDLPLLEILNCGGNEIDYLDVSNNPELRTLKVFDNPGNVKVIGWENLSQLTNYMGGGKNPLPVGEIVEKELKNSAGILGVEEQELENKSIVDTREMIKEVGDKIVENETKLNDPDNGLPGLLDSKGKIDNNELLRLNSIAIIPKFLNDKVGYDTGNKDWEIEFTNKLGGVKLTDIPKNQTLGGLLKSVKSLENSLKDAENKKKVVEEQKKELEEKNKKFVKEVKKELGREVLEKIQAKIEIPPKK